MKYYDKYLTPVSKDIQQTTGSYLGYAVNSAAGYGNPVSNYNGTVGTLNAALLTSPFAFCSFNPYMMTSSIYGCNPFNDGFFGSGMFGGYNNFGCGLGVPSFFSPMGFYCWLTLLNTSVKIASVVFSFSRTCWTAVLTIVLISFWFLSVLNTGSIL